MNWISVESTNLIRVRYDPSMYVLEIEFKGGRQYQYFDVPESVFEGLCAAVGAHGEYFNANIRGQFRYARV